MFDFNDGEIWNLVGEFYYVFEREDFWVWLKIFVRWFEENYGEVKVFDFIEELFDGDDEFWVWVFDLFGDFVGGVERICSGENGVDGGDGEEVERELVWVWGED